jgi:hypothetical protein
MTLKIPIHHKSKGTHDMLIDEEDYDKIKDLNLTLNHSSNKHTFYAKHIVYENCKYIKTLSIHRVIMGLGDFKDDKRQVNHIDGNGLNNQKSNLEICSAMYNSQSFRQPHRKCKSYYFENDPKRKCKWRVTLKINGVSKSKRFMTEEECIKYINELINLETI